MKKAFTLIELLAVIVILSILALIVSPIISGVIKDSKKAAAERSTDGYVKAVELAQVKYQYKHTGNKANELSQLSVEYSGSNVIVKELNFNESGNVSDAEVIVDNYVCIYNQNEGSNCNLLDKNTFVVSYVNNNNNTVYVEYVKKGENVKNVPDIPIKSNYHGEWSNDGNNIQNNTTIYPRYYYLLTFTSKYDISEYVATLSTTSYKLYEEELNIIIDDDDIKINDNIIVTASLKENYQDYNTKGWIINNDDSNVYTSEIINITADTELQYYINYGCIAKGSKIAMADGTYKNVEDIKSNDLILTYDYYNGDITSKKVIYVIPDTALANVFTVTLENGNSLKIVDFEYLFDTNDKKFIPININTYKSAIGKKVMVNDNGKIGTSKIKSITLEIKEIEHYSLYSSSSINYIANDIVAMSPIGFANTRYTINNDYKIDYDKYNEDVKKYGVYTYDDFKDVCTEETFNNYNIKDIKAIVSKGYIDFDELKIDIKFLQEEIDEYSN